MATRLELTRGAARLEVDGRFVTVSGEAHLPGYGSPTFVAYRSSLATWEDGHLITEDEKQRIVDGLIQAGPERGMTIEVE